MRTLKQHIYENNFYKSEINEKLVINKNFKNDDYDLPNESGICLSIGYPNPDDNTLIKRTDLKCEEYYNDGKNILTKGTNMNISEEGIYYICFNTLWLNIFFFNDTARKIMQNIINDPEMEFNFNDYVPSLSNIINFNTPYKFREYRFGTRTGIKYTPEYLNELLKSIR